MAREEFAERWGRLDYAPDANMLEELNVLIREELIRYHMELTADDYECCAKYIDGHLKHREK